MTDLTDEPDDIVETAYAVLEGNVSEGTKGVRQVEREDEPAIYRIDPDADLETVDDVTESGEIADAETEAVMWQAGASQVRQEREHRDLHD